MNLRFSRLECFLTGSTILGAGTWIIYKTTNLFSKEEFLDTNSKLFQVNKEEQEDANKVEKAREEFVKSLKDYIKFFPNPRVIKYQAGKDKTKKIRLEWLSGISVGNWTKKKELRYVRGKKHYKVKIWSTDDKTEKVKCRYTWSEVKNPNGEGQKKQQKNQYEIFENWKKICEEKSPNNKNLQI